MTEREREGQRERERDKERERDREREREGQRERGRHGDREREGGIEREWARGARGFRHLLHTWRCAWVSGLQELLEFKDTHRPYEGPMLLDIDLP